MPPRIPRFSAFLHKQARVYSTSTERVKLAFDLHAPSKPIHNAPGAGAIIFMHGLFGSKKNNRSISKQLARDLGRPVYAVDLRNHGDSPHHPRHDYMAMAEDIEAFIAEHNLTQPTLIGHSMGAKTAMTLALKSPSLIENLIPVDNAPLDAALLSSFGTYIRGMKALASTPITKQSEALSFLEPYESSLVIRQFLLGNLHKPPGEKHYRFKVPLKILGEALDNLGDFPYKDPEMVRCEKETLMVRGTQSKYVPDEAIPIIGRFFPRFRMVDIDCGHWVTSEKPEEFRQAVLEFLKPKE